MGYFSKIYETELPHRAKAVYFYLKDRSNAQGQCYPAIGTIARELGLSRRTVERGMFDPSGMRTPRTFGEGPYDFSYGPNYIVINLDTFQVCEFLSPFNYHYTQDGGRTFTLTNLRQLE